MAQVASFMRWFNSHVSIPLSDFRVRAGKIPEILRTRVNVVIAFRNAPFHDPSGYILVCFRPSLLSKRGLGSVTEFCLTWTKRSSSNGTIYKPLSHSLDFDDESTFAVAIRRESMQQSLLGPFTDQEQWRIDYNQLAQPSPGLRASGEPFNLGNLIDICEQISQEYAALTSDKSLPLTTYGSAWFESTLSDYLRGKQCFGRELQTPIPTWLNTMQMAQRPVGDRSRYTLENHTATALPNPLSRCTPVDTTGGQNEGASGVGAYSSVSSISEPQFQAPISTPVSRMDQWSSVTETPTYIQSVSSARPSCRSPFPYSTTAIIPAPTQHPSLASMYLSPSYAIMHHFTRSEDSDHQPRYDHLGSTRPAQIRMDSYSAQQDCQSKQVSQMVDYQPMHALHYPSSEDQSPHGGQYSGQMYNNRHTTIQSSAADASYMFQPKHAPTYESTVVEESSVHMESRRSKYEEATNYVAIPKRNMSALVEDERNQTEPNMKRIKITNADAEGAEHPLDPEDIETTGLLMSLAISRTMPLPDVVALLLQHGCQDITEMINLRTCSEYPLSFGGFGDIFRGELNDGASVAIKCVKIVIDSSSSEHEKYLKCAAREIYAWSKLDHRYVSKLLGLAQFRGQIAMVSPWAEHGALPWFLTRRPQHNRPRLCAQIADGLAFLHEQKIVHGDLKGANILISKNYEPLLTDFGNAILHNRSLQFTGTTAKFNFSTRWAAPELLDEAPSSFEADVYALGMTILEAITGKVPYAGMKDMAVINAINSKRHPKRPEEHIPTTSFHGDRLWSLLSRCWAFEPKARPSAQEAQGVMVLIDPEGLIPSERTTSRRADAA